MEKVSPSELLEFLLATAMHRTPFIWGAPGIGKTSVVEQFAEEVGMECVSLLGNQLAPEDIIGVPKIEGDFSVFCPPKLIARQEPYVLFLDELNASSAEVQKAFYSLILDHRIGGFHLPKGTIVIAAGNRSEDNAIVRKMSSALINRMVHVEMVPDVNQWLSWATEKNLHSWVIDFIRTRGDMLWSLPPKTQEPFSTPRSWATVGEILSDSGKNPSFYFAKQLAFGNLTQTHAQTFLGFVKNINNLYEIDSIIKGKSKWPSKPEDSDSLYFLAMAFRDKLIKELPDEAPKSSKIIELNYTSKQILADLSRINEEMATLVIAETEEGKVLPPWYLAEVIRELPSLNKARK